MNSAASTADRFARFKQRHDVRRITHQYAEWARQSAGIAINIRLAGLAILRLRGRITQQEYTASIRDLAASSKIPKADFLVLAECALEQTRCLMMSDRKKGGQL